MKVGAPLSNAFDGAPGALFSEDKLYTVGVMLDVHLPAGLGIELDLLYRRLSTDRVGGGAWQFPLLGKYRLGAGRVKPYAAAGLAFRHLSGLADLRQELRKRSNTGLVLGTGLEIRAPIVRVSPEIRYTRWGSENFGDSPLRTQRNQAEFLIGVTF